MNALEHSLGYVFKQPSLLEQALTHPSTAQQKNNSAYNNQRLEFLGDAVLGVLIAEMLYAMFPSEAEGDLSKRLVALVNGGVLAQVAQSLSLGEYLILSASEADVGGRNLTSNLEDACEAIIGAMYLDGGLDVVRPFIERYWLPLAKEIKTPPKDPKTGLQEWAQARNLALPEYNLISETGPSHAPQFVIEVCVKGGYTAQATAGTKKQAERIAAEALLKTLGAV